MNIVITGSGRGIGAYLFDILKKKHKVTGISRSKGKRTTLRADISKKEEVKKIFSKIPVIDVLINNASISSAHKDGLINFDKIISTNLNGTFYCSFFSIPKLKKSKVRKIINISNKHTR